ncbi:Asp-tRNA(Asn)/Glu-tRNA(Gln) amidotransferase subunit GatA, partial [candidate division KSB1 bacterium]|nr:Asp-tRNA(Asn)/Glu-tRNA(Gln) amidotransferase subunit GatA [candidate division KSB1 bacterium]NIR70142.1 Asp-tRNA(Asn)/Glu-tRNA(Gln) amidotransferase subunit GatA [candidate division KSB1 bacterium]NIS28054.1 Asp-tRNA(Asn)/Glu-tRNA(Gln) amidotransferase subunit GatA [candidate division KSB1 bacterium]NIT74923.1 Asp-tRNA(Asn)/Glu-tRNA(Gln) amidotransferase subunit GatA [candidate division KSB1 bacterium]NIU28707.1 Asp-tRNA(Asn)/Glu-tRNA(Gln) amidotransferase subunit GatA [candidate division KS
EEVDRKVQSGQAGKLTGAILAVKDNIVVKGKQATCGSRILENFISPYDATVIQKLEAEDAILIGKTNMDEFAMGSSNENSYFGPTKNPYDLERVSGGSSGGSCVAVATDMSNAGIGSDTGGSIRQPASFCNVVGMKPTYGRVSRFGLIAFASSFDQIGPISKTVADAALLLEVISGHDERDSTSVPLPVPEFSKSFNRDVKGLKIGLPKEYFAEGLDEGIRRQLERTADVLRDGGVTIVEVSMPHTDYAIASYYILATAEASSNLARYDGARYGFRARGAKDLEEMYVSTRSQGFGEEVKRRIMLGTYVLSAGYYKAFYRKAQKVQTLITQDFRHAFEQCDCLLAPTSPTPAFKIGEKVDDPLAMYLSDIYTVSVNLAGLPAISIPCGNDSGKLPIGAQIIGKHFDEESVLRVANFVETNLT